MQILKDVEIFYGNYVAFDMEYGDFKRLCREAWENDHF